MNFFHLFNLRFVFLSAIHAIVAMRSSHCDRRPAIIAGRLFCLMRPHHATASACATVGWRVSRGMISRKMALSELNKGCIEVSFNRGNR